MHPALHPAHLNMSSVTATLLPAMVLPEGGGEDLERKVRQVRQVRGAKEIRQVKHIREIMEA